MAKKKIFYALKSGSRLSFSCVATNKAGLEINIEGAYWGTRGMQTKGLVASYTIDDFLKGKEKVKITVESV